MELQGTTYQVMAGLPGALSASTAATKRTETKTWGHGSRARRITAAGGEGVLETWRWLEVGG